MKGNRNRRVSVVAVLAALALAVFFLVPQRAERAWEGLRSVLGHDQSSPRDPQPKVGPGLPLDSPVPCAVVVVPTSPREMPALEKRIVALGGNVLARIGKGDGVPRLRVCLAGTSIAALAAAPEVKWIERRVPRRFFNDVAVSNILMNVETVRAAHGLTGRGQVITTSDSGIDTGDFATLHADLSPNLIGFAKSIEGTFVIDGGEMTINGMDVLGHGTHTAGSLVGTGACSGGRFKGVAYEAKLWAWFCGGADGYVYTPVDFADTFRPSALGTTNAYVHSASWGGDANVYSTESQAIDTWCWNHPDFLPVFAAGNAGKDSTISAEAAAKNVLAVGGTESYRPDKGTCADNPDELAYFSSRGPMPDGRIKPDLCAPGTYVVSTRSAASTSTGWGVYDEHYLYNGGTSMATPLTAGTVALVRQWLVEDAGFTNRAPSAALMKAIVTGGATRLGAAVPNKSFGWGRVNLGETLFPTNGASVILKDYLPFGASSVSSFQVTVTNAAPLDVQLCWIDYPAEPSAAETRSLVIDLDLVVSNETTGVCLSPDDHLNNLEAVRLDVAEPGVYTVLVRGCADCPYNSAQGGAAAVYVRGAVVEGDNVELRLTVRDDYGNRLFYPDYGTSRWIPRLSSQTISLDQSPLLRAFASSDRGRTVTVGNGTCGTLAFTRFRVAEGDGAATSIWNAADHCRPAETLTLAMAKPTVVDFCYAETSARHETAALPYWWWTRQFAGALENAAETGLSEADAAATGDPDGDGFDNAAECAEPTDPWDATSFPFRFTDFSPTGLVFIASPGGRVRVQRADRLDGAWTNVWESASGRSGVTNRVEFSPSATASGFYRMLFD